ncbi:hypothetical protein GGQ87_000495 [Brevundimonas alba]|uniref:Lipoprotein n=1 Tax=Brevundimonas alba TaxID=74314 RepID=A0A7X6BME1_9CAUL|nr:hypothetical protein [Brevundimonas alba]NJC40237.1 hypothetical protein [Brevundimonas alba]
MRRHLISLVLAVSTAACLAGREKIVDVGGGQGLCRYELARLPAPMALFDLNARVGGSTCFTGTDTLLFLPSQGAPCVAPEGVEAGKAIPIGRAGADTELRRCFASARSEPQAGTGSITYTGLVADVDLIQFGLDTNALAAADGLPITRIVLSGARVCVETNQPSVVDHRIRAADIINFEYIQASRSAGHCSP